VVGQQGSGEGRTEGEEKDIESKLLRQVSSTGDMKGGIHDLRDEFIELQGQLGELRQEMVKMATAPTIFLWDLKHSLQLHQCWWHCKLLLPLPRTCIQCLPLQHTGQDCHQDQACPSTIPGFQAPLQGNP